MKKFYFLLLFLAILIVSPLFVNANTLNNRLSGRILLQVEENGEAYYLHPDKMKLFYLGRPDDAFAVMRDQGVGISNFNIAKIPVALDNLSGLDSDGDGIPDALETALGTNPDNSDSDGDGYSDYNELLNNYNPSGQGELNYDLNFARAQAGKMLIQVERNGEAFYVNPVDLRRHYLGRPADAFNVMRNLGLGVTNDNLNKFSIENVKKTSISTGDFVCGDDLEFTYGSDSVVYETILKNNLCWLDRNLGASRACLDYDDLDCYGDYFQWGRGVDGHQLVNSQTSSEFSKTNTPGHNKFIIDPWPYSNKGDWLVNQDNSLWQGVDGQNNPCPDGWRIPSEPELKAEQKSWKSNDNLGAYRSALHWPVSGYRDLDGIILGVGERGFVWGASTLNVGDDTNQTYYSSSLYWMPANYLEGTGSFTSSEKRGYGYSVRCVMDYSSLKILKENEKCGNDLGVCGPGLQCAYPCGIPGCTNKCLPDDWPPIPSTLPL
jgi:uncharacterized protein (TIGR02145 family)